jgi:hypothetical protein
MRRKIIKNIAIISITAIIIALAILVIMAIAEDSLPAIAEYAHYITIFVVYFLLISVANCIAVYLIANDNIKDKMEEIGKRQPREERLLRLRQS